MKKKLFTILTIVLGTMFMVSCGGNDDPDPAPVNTDNAKILTVMQNNYLWPLPANPNLSLDTRTFFGSLLSQNDKYTDGNITYTYSRISSTSDPVTTVYDAGFEYAINNYVSGVTYYVVLYVKPGTPASSYLTRGLYITKVGNTTVTAANAATLLPAAYAKGGEIAVSIRTPMIETERVVRFAPAANYVEAPMLTSKVLMAGSKKVGYIVYNNFSQGSNGAYDTSLANKLTEFKSQGVTTLVFDVRYNSGGSVYAVQSLGSALVKARDTNKAFIQQVFRPDLPKPFIPLNFQDKTGGGTTIPTLGDNLDKIYIITGQTTAGAPEALINALKAYRNADIVLVGEKTKGRNIATARTTENGATSTSGNWNLTLAYNYLADVNKNYNYTAGFTPSTVIKEVEVAATNKILLGELGTEQEVILSRVLAMISGTAKSTSVLETRSMSSERELKTSLGNRPGSNETTVDLQQ